MAKGKHEPVSLAAVGDFGKLLLLCSCGKALNCTQGNSQAVYEAHVASVTSEKER